MTYADISPRHNSGPYFSVGPVNQYIYLTQLTDWLVKRLEHISLTGKVWFLQDETPADCTRPVGVEVQLKYDGTR